MTKWSTAKFIEFIEELEATLHQKEQQLEDLDKENMRLGRRKKGRGDDDDDTDEVLARAAVDAELEDLRDKYENEQLDNGKLRDKINELNSYMKGVESEKLELEADVRRLRKKADDLETTLSNVQESTRSTLRKSQDITKQQKDVQRQQLHALEENEKLMDQVKKYMIRKEIF